MNTNIAVPNQGPWPMAPMAPPAELGPGQRTYSATNILDFATLLRIIQHWRWLVLGALALGMTGAILATLLTTPVYRARVTLEANPPTVSISEEQTRERESAINSYDFVATQVGLLTSRSVNAPLRILILSAIPRPFRRTSIPLLASELRPVGFPADCRSFRLRKAS